MSLNVYIAPYMLLRVYITPCVCPLHVFILHLYLSSMCMSGSMYVQLYIFTVCTICRVYVCVYVLKLYVSVA